MTTDTATKKILSNSIVYTISGLLLKCFSFFLLPLYTRYLTTEEYGISGMVSTFITGAGLLVSLSLLSAILRFYVDLKDDPQKLKRFYGTISVFVFATSIIFGIVMYLIKDILSKYFFDGIDFFPVICICLITLVFYCQLQIYETILKSQQKASKYSVIIILFFFTVLISNIINVVFLKLGIKGVVLSTMLANIVYTLVFWIDMGRAKTICVCFDITLLKDSLKYSLPIVPHDLSTVLASFVSRALIGGFNSFSTLGIYSVAAQFGQIADTVQVYINNAYGPWLYEKLHLKEAGYKKDISVVVNCLCCLIGLFFICLSLFAHDYIVLFVNKSYVSCWTYIPLLVIVYSIKIVYYFFVNVLLYYKKASKLLFTATLTSSILNVVLSYIFIPRYGVYGSVFADAIAMILRTLIVVAISRKFDDIGLKIRDFVFNISIIILFIFGGLALSYLKFFDTFSIINFLYKIFFVLLYIVFVFFRFKQIIISFVKRYKLKRN